MQYSDNHMKASYKIYILSIVICLILGYVSGFAVKISDFSWYNSLHKPVFNPPRWVFAPVWTILYIMIGLSAVSILRSKNLYIKLLFIMQFICNLLWTPLFFYYHKIDYALYNIICLFVLLTLLLYRLYKDSPIFYLLLPYYLWVAFATILNYNIYVMNV